MAQTQTKVRFILNPCSAQLLCIYIVLIFGEGYVFGGTFKLNLFPMSVYSLTFAICDFNERTAFRVEYFVQKTVIGWDDHDM